MQQSALATEIQAYLKSHGESSSSEIHKGIGVATSYATLKRMLVKMVDAQMLQTTGQRKGTKYYLDRSYLLFAQIDLDDYFENEMDDRQILTGYNFDLIPALLTDTELFTHQEIAHLNSLHEKYIENIKDFTEEEYKSELDRLAIDLSWKSAQIEGNTYSLLETERLLKEKETAEGKKKDEAVMLLNHKDALDFIIDNTNYLQPISVARIEDIHSILMKDLGIGRNIRIRRVRITGTNYEPLDNDVQIREALEKMCHLLNAKASAFDRALLALLLLSYIQPFTDGNKRTARIISNTLLMGSEICPLSFRTVDSLHYKKAMLLFYEQNNLTAFKQIFIDQFEFAVNNYF